MNWRRRKRLILLFFGATFVLAILLIAQAVRVIRQDREIAEKRAEQHVHNLEQLRNQLADRLDAVKVREVRRRLHPGTPGEPAEADPAVAFAASIENGKLVFPWPTPFPQDNPDPRFSDQLQTARSAEFTTRDYAAATAHLHAAMDLAQTAIQRCEIRLSLARVLVKSGQMDAAQTVYRTIEETCGGITGPKGIPYRLFALQGLIHANLASTAEKAALLDEADKAGWLPPVHLYLLRALIDSLSGFPSTEARLHLAAQIHKTEQISALNEDLERVRIRLDSATPRGHVNAKTVWLAYGSEPWLVTIIPMTGLLPPLLLAVSSRAIAPPGVRLTAISTSAGDLLGGPFLDLRANWTQERYGTLLLETPAILYGIGLALILGIALVAGYLLIRDIDRS